MRNDRDNLIVDLTFKFSLAILEFCEGLERDKKYILARQLLKSGTSIGANVREETEYWLMLCKESPHYPNPETILDELQSIIRVISKIISSSKT